MGVRAEPHSSSGEGERQEGNNYNLLESDIVKIIFDNDNLVVTVLAAS